MGPRAALLRPVAVDPPHVTRGAGVDAHKLTLARQFRRQQVIVGFVVDFYCAKLRLVLELDGSIHDDPAQTAYDAIRARILSTRSIQVVRIPNAEVNEPSLRARLAPYVEPPSPFRERGVGG